MLRMAVKRNGLSVVKTQGMRLPQNIDPALATEEGYVICDSKAKGCPIRHTSAGFDQMFGKAECVELRDAISPPSLHSEVKALAREHGLSEEAARLGMERMAQAHDAAQAAGTGKSSLVIAKRQGELVVCEVCWWKRQHPALSWTYQAAMLRVSDISVCQLLEGGAYEQRRAKLEFSEEWDGLAEQMWKEELAKGIKPKMQTQRSEGTSSIWSRSTASTLSSERKKEKSHHLGALLGLVPHEPEPQEACERPSFSSDVWEECETLSECSDGSSLCGEVLDPVAHVSRESLRSMQQPFILAAPTEGFQVALRSAGFEALSGPSRRVPLGRDAREGLRPRAAPAPRAEPLWEQFCASAVQGEFFKVGSGGVALLDQELPLAAGEFAFVQPLAGRLGNPMDCLVYLKQIELDDCPYLLALHSYLSDDESLEHQFHKVSGQVDEIIFKLAAEYLYYAPMRRQRAC